MSQDFRRGEDVKQIENYSELSKLIFSCLKKNVLTNCFLSKEDWEFEIYQKNVYYFLIENNLFIFRKREDFWIFNYYVNGYFNSFNLEVLKEKFKQENLEILVAEVVGRKINDENYQKQQDFLKQLGLKKVLTRERFENVENVKLQTEKNEDMLNISVDNKTETLEYEITLPDELDSDLILEFLKANFNNYYGCIPLKEKVKEDINEKLFYIAKIDEEIIGVLHFRKSQKTSEIRHLAVKNEWRGQGVGKKLINNYLNEMTSLKKLVWTGNENCSAQKLYEKNGYKKDGYVSSVFMNN